MPLVTKPLFRNTQEYTFSLITISCSIDYPSNTTSFNTSSSSSVGGRDVVIGLVSLQHWNFSRILSCVLARDPNTQFRLKIRTYRISLLCSRTVTKASPLKRKPKVRHKEVQTWKNNLSVIDTEGQCSIPAISRLFSMADHLKKSIPAR